MDLVEFLNARLDEDEQAAQAAGRATGGDDPDAVAYVNFSTHDQEAVADHIARHDPARVLAEVDAKRRTLERHRECGTGIGYCDDGGHGWQERRGCPELADLALPYAHHPAYDEAWRP